MDQVQAYLMTNLPPSILSHVTSHTSTYLTIYQQYLSIQRFMTANFIKPLLATTTKNPDATSLILFAAILLISLAFLRMLYRAILWWIRMAIRAVIWGAFLSLGIWVWRRGVEGAWDDAVGVGQVWKREYERYERASRGSNRFGGAWRGGNWG